MDLEMKRKLLGILIITFIILAVVMFADLIVPTVTSTPIRFDISEPTVNTNLP